MCALEPVSVGAGSSARQASGLPVPVALTPLHLGQPHAPCALQVGSPCLLHKLCLWGGDRVVLRCVQCLRCYFLAPGKALLRCMPCLCTLCGRCCRLAVAGFFCAAGTGLLGSDVACRSPLSFCPEGSFAPLPTPTGHYALATVSGLFYNITKCEAGRYCALGVALPCPAGRYGAISAETSPVCSGICTQGYFCASGSLSPTAARCSGGPEQFCPQVWLCARVSPRFACAPRSLVDFNLCAAVRVCVAVCVAVRVAGCVRRYVYDVMCTTVYVRLYVYD